MSNPFAKFTQADVDAHNAKTRRGNKPAETQPAPADPGNESELHDKIKAACRVRGWIYFHDRMDKPTTGTQGRPDFIIIADKGRVFFIECKTAKGKLSVAQNGLILRADLLGTTIHVCRSMREFYKLIA